MYIFDISLFLFLPLSTLMTCNQYIVVSIALRLIAVAITTHVVSVESKAKINIRVNGINVESVESSEVNRCSGYCSCRECRE